MMRRVLLLIGFPIMFTHAAYNLVGCSNVKPASYGEQLADCEKEAGTWEEYSPCCVQAADRANRDPAFCFRDYDAGQGAR